MPVPLKRLVISVTPPLSPNVLKTVQKRFEHVHVAAADDTIPADVTAAAEVWFSGPAGLPKDIKSLSEVPNLKILQLPSAGFGGALGHAVFKDKEAFKQIQVLSTSGMHVRTIPQWIVGQIINVSFNIHTWSYRLRAERKWIGVQDIYKALAEGGYGDGLRPLAGRTAGMLGYGSIAREAARLLKAFGVDIIAANSGGNQKPEDGYVVPGTGDLDGSLPSAYYKTTDPASFDEFLSKSDFLIASLPSTPQTQYMLKEEHFAKLPKYSIFLNVGRGDLVSSDVLLSAINAQDSPLLGMALDVSDPEPLPADHALYSHPRVTMTPHVSGAVSGYMDRAVEVLLANMDRWDSGKPLYNAIDPSKGY